jgi:hypothetical protein
MIEELVNKGWDDHTTDSPAVFDRLRAALPEVTKPGDVPGFTALLVHVAGEHLGRWREGLDALAQIEVASGSPEEQAVLRGRATLLLGAGERGAAEDLIERAHPAGLPVTSTRVRVFAVAASALAGQKKTRDAIALFEEALRLASYGPGKTDPAARALAVTGNNLACALEETKGRTADEDRLMELAAKVGRRYWEVAGGWLEVERAEYRLAMTYIALGRGREALDYAEACLAICEKNGAEADEIKYAREAVAKARALN